MAPKKARKRASRSKPAEKVGGKRVRKSSAGKKARRTGRGQTARPGVGEPRRGQRLQKILAAAGLGSRRDCEELILAGRVEVDGQVVVELGGRVDPASQRIRVDGVPLKLPRRIWYAVNKPTGVVCTNRDPSGRPRAVDLVPGESQRLFIVGRLDMNSEGLLLLSNDGDLANQLTHPRYGVQKTYRVMVAGQVEPELLQQLRKGIRLAEGLAKVSRVQIKRRYKRSTILEMVLEEGRNREIRRVLARLGHKVMRLVRVGIGPIRLGNLGPGAYRRLTRNEVETLRRSVRRAQA